MKRRTFIYLTAAGTAALTVPAAGCRHYPAPLIKTLSQPDFLGHICDEKTIGDIGSAYRSTTPDESHRTDLVELLLKEVPGAQDDPHLPQLLKDQVEQDFATDNIVTIKGWVLSRTEARQCALYSMSLQ